MTTGRTGPTSDGVPRPSPVRAVVAVSALLWLIVLLHLAARFELRGPTGLSGDELESWLEDPLTVAATVARWIALAASYYLLVVVVVTAISGGFGETHPLRRLVPGGVAALAGSILGVGAVAIPLVVHMSTTDAPAREPPPTNLRPLVLDEVDEPLTLTPADSPTAERSRRSLADVPAENLAPGAELRSVDDVWPVAAGDHMWSIAQETLGEAWGRTDLTESEIAAYWRALIDANQDRLVEPGNADLILPGQEMLLPAAPPDPQAAGS